MNGLIERAGGLQCPTSRALRRGGRVNEHDERTGLPPRTETPDCRCRAQRQRPRWNSCNQTLRNEPLSFVRANLK